MCKIMAEYSKARLAFRYSCSMFHLVGISYHFMELDLPCHQQFGGRFKYLTIINMLLQWVYFTSVAVIELHVVQKKRKSEVFSSLCDLGFACWVFPLGIQVPFLFWTLYAMDPHTVLTEEEAKLIPTWLNHYMHTFPGLAVLGEVLLFKHEYPRKSTGFKAVLGFAVAYTAWVFVVLYVGNFWVYPFMAKMNVVQMAGFFGAAYVMVIMFYLIGEKLSSKFAVLERNEYENKKND